MEKLKEKKKKKKRRKNDPTTNKKVEKIIQTERNTKTVLEPWVII